MELITQRLKLFDISPEKAREIAAETGMKAEDIDLFRKGLITSDVQFVDGERAVISWITTNTIDADSEIVDPSGVDLERYNKNRVVLWCHKYDQLPLGDSMWIKRSDDGRGLISKTRYAKHAKAEEVYQYRKDGFPLAQSIGFIPLEWVDNPKEHPGCRRKYTKWELLEYSDVPVPNNPDAYTIAVSKGLIPMEEKNVDKTIYNGNYSVYDIFSAVDRYLNPGGVYRYWVADLYPSSYPSGEAIVGTVENDKNVYLSAPYTFSEGVATVYEMTEMKLEYTVKSYDGIEKAGRVLSSRNRTMIMAAVQQIDETAQALRELLNATEPAPIDEPSGGTVEMDAAEPETKEAEPVVEKESITKADLMQALKAAVANNRVDVAGIVDEAIARKLGRATLGR